MRQAAGLPLDTFSSTMHAGQKIKALHVTELRAALDEVRSVLQMPAVGYAEPIVARVTTVKRAQIMELRGGVQ
jgi:hypothetical protein